MQIFVLGMHRSGTSVVTRLLNLMGCYVGSEDVFNPADESNLKGYWERRDVLGLNDDLLEALGGRWDAPPSMDLDALGNDERLRFDERGRSILLRLDGQRPWVVKDPRACLLYPFWRPFLEAPLVVLVDRGPIEVARSLEDRDGLPLAVGLALWEVYNRAAIAATRDEKRILVLHRDLLADPVAAGQALHRALEEAGVRDLKALEPEDVLAFFDPQLVRARATVEEGKRLLTPSQAALAEAFASGAVLDQDFDADPSADALRLVRAVGELRTERDRLTLHNHQLQTLREQDAADLHRSHQDRQRADYFEGRLDVEERLYRHRVIAYEERILVEQRARQQAEHDLGILERSLEKVEALLVWLFRSRPWRWGSTLHQLARKFSPRAAEPSAQVRAHDALTDYRIWRRLADRRRAEERNLLKEPTDSGGPQPTAVESVIDSKRASN